MPKNVPDCPPSFRPPLLAHSPPHEFELATPLFGGGAEARVNDRSHPVSAKAIRGQLRFWWRATRGRVFANPADLWQREEEIFGSTEFASPLRVSVETDLRTPPQFAPKNEFPQGTPAGYALFALQPGDQVIREGLKFRLTLTWAGADQLTRQRAAQNKARVKAKQPPLPATIADIGDDLDVALRAWANLGGIGGRTRRGCGALLCKKLAPASAADVPHWFQSLEARFGAPAVAPLWPVLSDQRACLPTEQAAVPAWLRAMELFRDFRQGEGFGRDRRKPPSNRPGRSRFPEPETIRKALNGSGPRPAHQHPRQPHIPDDAFPRAEFGLPIVFHFQNNEVPDTVLYPRVGNEQPERMASPLILKPLCLANGKAVPLAVRLDGPWFTSVELTQRRRNNVVGAPHPLTSVRRPNLATYRDSPLTGSPNGSALEAFLNFITTNGFTRC